MYLNYTGVVDITPELSKILSGSPDAKSTEFGGSCKLTLHSNDQSCCCSLLLIFVVIEIKFETGDEGLKELEQGVFVGAGRFIVEEGKPVTVEYKVSRVVQGM